jgi:hypothetical protein
VARMITMAPMILSATFRRSPEGVPTESSHDDTSERSATTAVRSALDVSIGGLLGHPGEGRQGK